MTWPMGYGNFPHLSLIHVLIKIIYGKSGKLVKKKVLCAWKIFTPVANTCADYDYIYSKFGIPVPRKSFGCMKENSAQKSCFIVVSAVSFIVMVPVASYSTSCNLYRATALSNIYRATTTCNCNLYRATT